MYSQKKKSDRGPERSSRGRRERELTNSYIGPWGLDYIQYCGHKNRGDVRVIEAMKVRVAQRVMWLGDIYRLGVKKESAIRESEKAKRMHSIDRVPRT